VDWEFLVSIGVFAVLFLGVTSWTSRRVTREQRRTHWVTSIAVFVLVTAGLGVWNLVG
jgi:heme A synthase